MKKMPYVWKQVFAVTAIAVTLAIPCAAVAHMQDETSVGGNGSNTFNRETRGVSSTGDTVIMLGYGSAIYADAAIEHDPGSSDIRTPNENLESKKKVVVGILNGLKCGDYCYLTIRSKENKAITLRGDANLNDTLGKVKKKYKDVRVKVTWHTEKKYIPKDRTLETMDIDIVDKVEILN